MSERIRISGIVKTAADEQQVLCGWGNVSVLADGSRYVDAQGDWIAPGTLQTAQWRWVEAGGLSGVDHAGYADAHVVGAVTMTKEVQAAMGIPPGHVPEALWIEVRVPDRQKYLARKASRASFSIEGRGTKVPMPKENR